MHVPAVDLHLHNPHPRLDEPAREEAALADHARPVAIADALRLLGEIEGFEIDASQEPDRLGIHPIVGLDLVAAVRGLEVAIDLLGKRQPALEVLLGEIRGAHRVLEACLWIGHRHRREGRVEKAAAGMVVAVADEDIAGEIPRMTAGCVERPGAEGRMADGVDLRIARPHQIRPLLVGPGLGRHGPENCQPVRHAGELLHRLAEDDSRGLRLDDACLPLLLAPRLGIEGVEVAHRPAHEERDDVRAGGERLGRKAARRISKERVDRRHAEGRARDPGDGAATGETGIEPGEIHCRPHWMKRNSRVLRSAQIRLPQPVRRSTAPRISSRASFRSSSSGSRERTERKMTSTA